MSTDGDIAHARQFKRHAARFEARIEPHPDHAEQFRLSFPGAAAGLAVVDVSRGGLGLRAGVFLARNLRVVLHVSGVGAERGAQTLVIRAVVRRCAMVDHKPTYQIGLQFLDPTGRDEMALVEAVTGTIRAEPVLAGAGGARVA